MAINIRHTYNTHVEVCYYTEGGDYTLRCRDYGEMDDIAERVCEIIVKHNFSCANVCSAETGEILMTIKRS